MASTAIEGFVTGFSNTLAQGIQERNREARDFFNKQVEYARTTGLQNRQRVRQEVDAQIAVAKQLEQVGIPNDVIIQTTASGGRLTDLYATAEKIRAEEEGRPGGVKMTPERWREIFKVSEEYKAPDEDVATFIQRHYTPLSNAINDPSFEDDPRGSFVSRLMGFDAMDQANKKLETTVIADGMTAQDLINYGDYIPRPDASAGVTVDYTAFQGEQTVDPRDVNIYKEAVDKDLAFELDSAIQSGSLSVGGGDATAIRQTVLQNVTDIYGTQDLITIQRLVDAGLKQKGYTFDGEAASTAPESPVESPLEPSAGQGSTQVEAPPVEAPTAPAEPLTPEERMVAESAFGMTNVKNLEDGTVEATLADGRVRVYTAADMRKLLETQLGYRP